MTRRLFAPLALVGLLALSLAVYALSQDNPPKA